MWLPEVYTNKSDKGMGVMTPIQAYNTMFSKENDSLKIIVV